MLPPTALFWPLDWYAPVFPTYLFHTAVCMFKTVFLVGLATPQELRWLTPESPVPTSDWHIVVT